MSRKFWQSTTPPKSASDHPTHADNTRVARKPQKERHLGAIAGIPAANQEVGRTAANRAHDIHVGTLMKAKNGVNEDLSDNDYLEMANSDINASAAMREKYHPNYGKKKKGK